MVPQTYRRYAGIYFFPESRVPRCLVCITRSVDVCTSIVNDIKMKNFYEKNCIQLDNKNIELEAVTKMLYITIEVIIQFIKSDISLSFNLHYSLFISLQ